MYLRPTCPASAVALVGALWTAAGWAAPADLRGEVPGLGPVTLGELRGQPVSIVLMDRDHSDRAEPIGHALNSVMVDLGGRRVSVLDVSQSWDLMKPVVRQSLAAYRTWVLDKVREEYAAAGKVPPNDFEATAWLVADWAGDWKPTLAPGCAGVAVVVLDARLEVAGVLCDPEPTEAADRFRALLKEATPPPEEGGAGAGSP